MNKKVYTRLGLGFLLMILAGCHTIEGNSGQVQSFGAPSLESKWIRDGEPIEFEGFNWYPSDGIELFLDSEVRLIGEYRGVQFFVDKQDVRPYNRLYTKFARNQFRYFEKRENPGPS